jgi:hypothetical protein
MNEILKTLTIKVFHINQVSFGLKVDWNNGNLILPEKITNNYKDIKEAKVSLLKPYERDLEVNTILDIIPLSTKIYGNLGEGITHTLTGVYLLLTAKSDSDKQYFNFGSANGNLKNIVIPNRIGTFNDSDYLIHVDIVGDENTDDLRNTIINIHRCADEYIQEIRNYFKEIDGRFASEEHTYHEKVNKSGQKVVMIKQIGGQGAMHDNMLLPEEPNGMENALSIIDLKNMPILISPNEYRDGAIRAMT